MAYLAVSKVTGTARRVVPSKEYLLSSEFGIPVTSNVLRKLPAVKRSAGNSVTGGWYSSGSTEPDLSGGAIGLVSSIGIQNSSPLPALSTSLSAAVIPNGETALLAENIQEGFIYPNTAKNGSMSSIDENTNDTYIYVIQVAQDRAQTILSMQASVAPIWNQTASIGCNLVAGVTVEIAPGGGYISNAILNADWRNHINKYNEYFVSLLHRDAASKIDAYVKYWFYYHSHFIGSSDWKSVDLDKWTPVIPESGWNMNRLKGIQFKFKNVSPEPYYLTYFHAYTVR